MRGADAVYIVTEMTVIGLRQARRLAGMLKSGFDMEINASVIVNKRPWMGGGVSRQQASEALGPLAGRLRVRLQPARARCPEPRRHAVAGPAQKPPGQRSASHAARRSAKRADASRRPV